MAIEPINNYAITNPASVYDEEALTALELAGRTAAKTNECVEAFNELETDTTNHLAEQDADIAAGLATIPAEVAESVDEHITDGAFDGQINTYMGNLTQRMTNLETNYTPGGTTADTELYDIRVGADGNTYNTAGDAVRTQTDNLHNDIVDTRVEYLGVVRSNSRAGYYNLTHEISATTEYNSIGSEKIPCKQGDTFYYDGRGASKAPSVFFYTDNNIISTAYYSTSTVPDAPLTITIPANCNYVEFQSIRDGPLTPIFDVKATTIDNIPDILRGEMTDIEDDLQTQIDTNSLDVANIRVHFLDDIRTNTRNGFYGNDHVIRSLDDYNSIGTEKIPCVAGETFTYSGRGGPNAPSVYFYTDDTIISTVYYSGVDTPTTVTIPANCNYVEFQSIRQLQLTPLFNVEYTTQETIPSQIADLQNQIGLHDNILYGKKLYCAGDSFTKSAYPSAEEQNHVFTDGLYAGQSKAYPYYIGRRNNMTVVSDAIGGSTMTNISGVSSNPYSVTRYLNIPADADYITLKFGIGDGAHEATIGTIDDATNGTFYGAWNVVLDYITTNFQFAKVGIIVTNGGRANYAAAVKAVANKWGIPYLDEAEGTDIPLFHRSNRTDVSASAKTKRLHAWSIDYDGSLYGVVNTHPNEYAHDFESKIIEDWLKRI